MVKEAGGSFVQVRTIALIPPAFHRGSILRRGALKSTVINHQGGQMRCSIQSFPQLQIKALRTLQKHQGQSSKRTLSRRGWGHKYSYFWRIHSVFHCLDTAFVCHRARTALISIHVCLHQVYLHLTMVYLNTGRPEKPSSLWFCVSPSSINQQ